MSDNIFGSQSLGDLVGDTLGDSKASIDHMFKSSYIDDSVSKCLYCGRPATHKLMPKHKAVNTAQIQDKGYICEGCLSVKVVSARDFGIRKL